MKKRLSLVVLVAFLFFLGIKTYAEFDLTNSFETQFQKSAKKTNEDVGEYDIEALLDLDKPMSSPIDPVLKSRKKEIQNHLDTYLSSVDSTKKELIEQEFDEYEREKSEELRDEISEDIESYLNGLLD